MTTNKTIDTGELIEEHSDYLLSFALTKLSDREVAKDLVQDTFVSALTKLHTFEERSKLRTWLTSILNRKIIDYWRKAETRYTDPVSSFFSQDEKKGHWLDTKTGNATLETVLDKISESETIQELMDCLDTLPEKWRGIVGEKYLNEQNTEEICKDFDITPSNLWVIIHRAKLVLRDCLQHKWEL